MKKVLTIILDGFGYREEKQGNAIWEADPKNFLRLWNKYPHSLLWASEEPIGLMAGQFGNSEVGHMTIGAGRKLKQSIYKINEYLETMEDDCNYQQLVERVKTKGSSVHIMGLFSDGLVHSDLNHFFKMYDCLVHAGVDTIYFHLITDGRDTKTMEAYKYIRLLEKKIEKTGVGSIATICGRYYAMDRDNKLDRTKMYYDLVTRGVGVATTNLKETLALFYKKKITDEFLQPILLDKKGIIHDGDTIVWMNWRTDRAKQIMEAFTNQAYSGYPIVPYSDLAIYTFVPIDKKIPTHCFLEEEKIENPLGVYLSKLGLTQARIAETEKYAHVTYFFDGEYNGSLENCAKILVPSLKVKTYDLDPRMSAVEVTKKAVACMEKDIDFILVNFANPDMVGHTGNYEAAVKAVMTVDVCLGKLLEEAENNFYKVIVTADHGNIDTMLDHQKHIVTTHSLAKVPFVLVDSNVELKKEGDLTQIAPTILEYMDIAKPKEMKDTESLFVKSKN